MTGVRIAQMLAILYPMVLVTAMVLAFWRRTRPAAALATLVGASFMAWSVPTVLEWLRGNEAFTLKDGRAVLLFWLTFCFSLF